MKNLSTSRPPIIFITQALAILMAVMGSLGLLDKISLFLNGATITSIPLFLVGLSVQLFTTVFPLCLFFGLVKPRGWTRLGSMVFAIIMVIFVVIAFIKRIEVDHYGDNYERLGGWLGAIMVLIIALAYPIRLRQSPSVRAFFNIDQNKAA